MDDYIHDYKDGLVICFNHLKKYIKNGFCHRLNGPAMMTGGGNYKYWFYNGECIDCHTQEEFERIIKLFVFK
jgi:hypothetical protein